MNGRRDLRGMVRVRRVGAMAPWIVMAVPGESRCSFGVCRDRDGVGVTVGSLG
jgi:hypothetical protein